MSARQRSIVGSVFLVLVWGMYIVRVGWGVGIMRDNLGQQAPAIHYLAGALAVTGIVAVWLGMRAWVDRRGGGE